MVGRLGPLICIVQILVTEELGWNSLLNRRRLWPTVVQEVYCDSVWDLIFAHGLDILYVILIIGINSLCDVIVISYSHSIEVLFSLHRGFILTP